MKLNERMRYPHPVLSAFTSDYVSGDLKCSFSQNLSKDNEIRIVSKLDAGNEVVRRLISDQKAASGYFIVCRRTYFNQLQSVPFGEAEKFIEASKLFGAVSIRPVIWTLTDVPDLSSPLFDKEFGDSVFVPKGSIIALGPEFRFSIDQKRFKPFETVFSLAIGDSVKPGMVEVDADQEKITILAEKATYNSLAGMRNMPAGRQILLNAVYMPAVMDVISRLQTGDTGLQGQKWYRVFKAKCDDLGIDPSSQSSSSLRMAQELLKSPLKQSIAVAETM